MDSLAAHITLVGVGLLYSSDVKGENQSNNKRYQRSGQASIPIWCFKMPSAERKENKAMRPHEPNDESDHGPSTRRRGYSIFFFQQEGRRSYLRFTLLGVIVFALFIVIPVMAMLILFFINSRSSMPETNINVTGAPPASSSTNPPLIRQAPPPSPARNIKQPTSSMPTPPIPPTPLSNSNERLAPRHTPQPTPSESPP